MKVFSGVLCVIIGLVSGPAVISSGLELVGFVVLVGVPVVGLALIHTA